jgi:exodeoxyribonuclease-3
MRIVTYNVNSIATRASRVVALLEKIEPDVVLVQETKTTPAAFPRLEFEGAGYSVVELSLGRWAGVAILVKHGHDIADVRRGLAGEPEPSEARWVEAVVSGIRVVSVYVPNGRAVGTDAFRDKLVFFEAMARRAREIAGDPAVIGGDMNVCPSDLDVWNPAEVHGATHVTKEERAGIRSVLEAGYVDAFRRIHPDEPGYTWWDYRAGHFHKGFGLRIDLVLVGSLLAPQLSGACVEREFRKPSAVPGTKPSDHAPVTVDMS